MSRSLNTLLNLSNDATEMYHVSVLIMDRMVNITRSGHCMNGRVIEKTRRAISVETKNCVKSEERAKMAVRMILHKQSRPAN